MKFCAYVFIAFTLASTPAAAATSCQLAVDADFPVTYVAGHMPVIVVQIQGQPIRMIVDTGSDGSFLSERAYNALNLHRTYDGTGWRSVGLGGIMQISAMVLVDLHFGNVRLHDEVMPVTDKAMPDEKGQPVADGILGYDVLENFDIGLDLPNNRITFYTPQHCTTPQTPWPGDYAPALFTRPNGGGPLISEAIDNHNFTVVIDTGADTSLIMQASLTRAGITPEATPAGRNISATALGNLEIGLHNEKFSDLTIGAEDFPDDWLLVDVTRESDINATTDGLLGEDYFATHRVFIANSTNVAYLGLTAQ